MNYKNKVLILLAKVFSGLFNPMIIPLGAISVLISFTYLSILPPSFKLVLLNLIFCFTFLIPLISIWLFKRMNKSTNKNTDTATEEKARRSIQYIFALIAYIFCFSLMKRFQMPWFMNGIILTAILIQIVLLLLNLKWRICLFSAGLGAVTGGILAFSILFIFNPLHWLCISILVSGIIGSSRIILKRQTFGEVLTGWSIGFLCCALVLHPYTNYMFRYFLY